MIFSSQQDTLDKVHGSSIQEKLHSAWLHMQTKVNCVFDSNLAKMRFKLNKVSGIKQVFFFFNEVLKFALFINDYT